MLAGARLSRDCFPALAELCGLFPVDGLVRCGMDIAPPPIPEIAAASPQIEVSGLTKLYGQFTAVNDLSFAVRPGEVIGLVGPNGAGKTTTLRCLAGIIPPTRGTVRIGGFDMAQNPIEAKRRLAFFPDEPRLFEYLTVNQHL